MRSAGGLLSLVLALQACASSKPADTGPNLRRAPEPASPAPASREDLIARGDAALALHRPDRFSAAIAAYEEALLERADARVLSAISRVYAVWSQLAREQPQADPNADARQLAEQARRFAERALQPDPGNAEAGVALSDALRLTSALDPSASPLTLASARAELDRVAKQSAPDDVETLRVAALLEIEEYSGAHKAGRALAERAVAKDPTLLRTRFLAARCALDAGDKNAAQQHVDAVAQLAPDHPLLAPALAALSAK